MARRLNKKVAIIGSLVLALMIVGGILVILRMSKNPQKFIKDAESAMAMDKPDYKAASKAYGRAFAYTKDTKLKVNILFKLSNLYIDSGDWVKAAGCWKKITTLNPDNIKARLSLLNYSCEVADAGNWTVWKDVETDSSKLIDKKQDTSPRMYRIKGRAILEQVKSGQKTDKKAAINQAIKTLQKAQQLEPNNVAVYEYLADAATQKGKILSSEGVMGAEENARQNALKILTSGIKNCPDNPQAYINLYKPDIKLARNNPEILRKTEKELTDISKKFPSSSLPFFALSRLYLTDPNRLDDAIKAIVKAREIEKENVSYALNAANLYYRRYVINKNESDFDKAVKIATQALGYPDSVIDTGPRTRIGFMNRFTLHTFLANSYIGRVSKDNKKEDNQAWIEKTTEHVRQIDQLIGSAEHPYVIMWKGRLALAAGNTQKAIKLLYTSYNLLTASGKSQADPQLGLLSYDLARALKSTNEVGAVSQFLQTAITNGIQYNRPKAVLEYAIAMFNLHRWQNAIEAVNFYRKSVHGDQRADNLLLSTYISANMLDEAEKIIKKRKQNDPNTIRFRLMLVNSRINDLVRQQMRPSSDANRPQPRVVRANMDNYKKEQGQLIEKILDKSIPINESTILNLCKEYIRRGNTVRAKEVCEKYLKYNPKNIALKIFKLRLDEPEPNNVSAERMKQLTLKVLDAIDNTVAKNLSIGQYYLSSGDSNDALGYYRSVLEQEPNNPSAISALFNIYSSQKNFKKCESLVASAKKYNIDKLDGKLFQTRLAIVKKDYKTALAKIDNCLEEKPIFSYGYFYRSRIDSAMGNYSDAVNDAKKASGQNPLDGTIAKNLVFIMQRRNQSLGENISPEQKTETLRALQAAIAVNPMDIELKSFYADYISSTHPKMAISIAQQIQKALPTVKNSLRLAGLAAKVAAQEPSKRKQQVMLYGIAEDACKKAYKIDPHNQEVLSMYSNILTKLGRADEAQKLISGDNKLLWRYYLNTGQTDLAKSKLLDLYKSNPDDANVVGGLLLVSIQQKDNKAILKYSNELLKINDSIRNQIFQIESLLEAGLVKEGQLKLESFREKNPNEPQAMFLQAWLLAKQGKIKEALLATNKNIELDSSNARAWQLRGQLNAMLSNFNKAVGDFQKSKTLQDSPETRINLAKAYFALGRTEEAVAELKTTISKYNSQQARLLLEQIYLHTQRFNNLESFYQKTLSKFPNGVDWYIRAGNFAIKQKKDDQAIKLFDRALQNSLTQNSKQPSYIAVDGKMRALLQSKKYRQVLTEAARYLDSPYAPIAYARMANAEAKLGDKKTAIQYFRKALDKTGSNEGDLIRILQEMDRVIGYEETVKYCNERLRTEPDSVAVNLAMFNLHRIAGKYNKALKYINKCIALAKSPQEKFAYIFNKANTLQLAYAKTSDDNYLEQTIKEYQSLLKKDPNNITLLNNIAYSLAESGKDFGKAVKYAQRAYEAVPNSAGILDTYGYTLLMNKEYTKADQILQMALQQFEQAGQIAAPPEVYEHIGMVKEKLNQKKASLKAYQRAIDLGGNSLSKQRKQKLENAVKRMSQ